MLNLVFFKPVRSKTKLWQMMGRGTRLCPDLFGPGQDKEFYRVFDYCMNLEFFGANPEVNEAGAAKSLSARLFAARLDLVCALDKKHPRAEAPAPHDASPDTPPAKPQIRQSAMETLKNTVAGLNLDNFIVRQRRRTVEKYQNPAAWISIDAEARTELVEEIAPLPSAHTLGTEDAKRFDLLMFSLELALLQGARRFATLRKQLVEIAEALDAQTGIPAIACHAELIGAIQTDHWWEGINVSILELVRLRLRDLIQHIEKTRQVIVYSNFADEIGECTEHDLPQVGEADFARFKAKARHFLRGHEDHIVLHKLRHGTQLTPTDLTELETMLLQAGIGEQAISTAPARPAKVLVVSSAAWLVWTGPLPPKPLVNCLPPALPPPPRSSSCR